MSTSNSKASHKTPKRKADSGVGNSSRKRAQNRVSQQCLRERNIAHVRSLENTVQLLQSAANDANGRPRKDRYSVLLEAHLKQLEENQRLREALLRLRKKLLSLSTAAAADADDEIFDSILGIDADGNGESSRANSQDCQDPTRTVDGIEPPGSAWMAQGSGVQSAYIFDSPSVPSSAFENSAALSSLHAAGSQTDGDDGLQTMLFRGQDNSDLEALSHLGLMMPSLKQRIAITSITLFGAKLLSACQQYIKRAGFSAASSQENSDIFCKKLTEAAANFTTCCMGLESYIYGVKAASCIEKVISWRLGLEGRDCIPSPFRPTPLQARNPTHCLAVDMYNWPDIRDQLVLEPSGVDFDMITKDVILNTVIDRTSRGVAVSVLDIFYNQIHRHDKTPVDQSSVSHNYLKDPSWVLFEVNLELPNAYSYETDPVEQAFMAELEKRMRNPPAVCLDNHSLPLSAEMERRSDDISAFFGLNNFSEWKLSKEFAKKYPFLDCSTAVSKCDMAPSAMTFFW